MENKSHIRYVIAVTENYAMLDIKGMLERALPGGSLVFATDSVGNVVKRASEADVDLIVTDMELSDGRAPEMLSALHWTKPVILFSEYPDSASFASSCNCMGYLLKPVTEENLNHALANLKINMKSEATA